MPRIFSLILGLIASAVLALLAIVLLANVTGPRTASHVTVEGLGTDVALGIDAQGVVHVQASSLADMYLGLGYAHAMRQPWLVTLLKVTSAGRLSQYQADSAALAIDHHIATLGLASTAQRAYGALPDSLRALFDAYVAGVNASFDRNRLDRSDEFIVFPVVHERWEPWHPIAIEMLVAYLASTVEMERVLRAGFRLPDQLQRFVAADSLLRTVLAVDGLHHSLAFTVADTAGTSMVHRLVYGQSGLPIFQLIGMATPAFSGAVTTVPGTLAFWGGKDEARSWAVVPSPRAALEPAAATPPEPRYARVVRRDGGEALVTSRRSLGRLFIAEAEDVRPPPPDTLAVENADEVEEDQREVTGTQWWTLSWSGIAARGTDLQSWLALLTGADPDFEVLHAATLIVSRDGATRVAGQAAFTTGLPGGTLIAGSDAATPVAERLARGEEPLPHASAGIDPFSAWAAELAPPLVEALGHPDSVALNLRDAVAFLQGWDHRFEGNDVAASIFERWMASYRNLTGHFPEPDTLDLQPAEVVDTLQVRFAELVAEQVAEARQAGRRTPPIADTLAANPELADSLVTVTRPRLEDPPDLRAVKRSFEEAIEALREEHGRPGPAWHWQRIQQASLRFPGHTARPGTEPPARRFRDVPLSDGGHPTAVLWGPSPLLARSHTAVWSAWISTAEWGRVDVAIREPFQEPPDVRYVDPPEPTPVRSWRLGTTPEITIRLSPPS